MAAITVDGLVKRFDAVEAVGGISFSVDDGELFGFLGPNGAGKSTTINMLTGLARPDAGTIQIGGIDCSRNPKAAQHLFGVVPDESNLYPELTGHENLCFCAALYGMRKAQRVVRARELLDMFGLSAAADRKFGGYSRGMKRKLAIAAAIIHEPRILFLDEPTTGIDVAGARQIRQLVDTLRQRGTTIFLTTHYIEEAERLCDRIAFIVGGRIVRTASVSELVQPLKNRHVVEIACETLSPDIAARLQEHSPDVQFTFPEPGIIRVESDHPVRVGHLVRFLEEHGADVREARKIQLSLEDVFVQVTGIETAAMRREKEKKGGGQ